LVVAVCHARCGRGSGLLKGGFDLAVDPGLQFYYLNLSTSDQSNQTVSNSSFVFYFHAPVLLGINLSENVSLVLSPGVTYGYASTSVTSSSTNSTTQQAAGSTGIMARGGLGVDVRFGKKFALHPEITFLKGFQDDEALLYIVGIGLNIGPQPDYSDLGGAAPTARK
jgi:hypothetical protein